MVILVGEVFFINYVECKYAHARLQYNGNSRSLLTMWNVNK